jgi:hypothetical protein
MLHEVRFSKIRISAYYKEELRKEGANNTYKSLNLSMKTYCGSPFESRDGLYGIQPEYLTTSFYLVQLWMSMAANHSKASKTFSSLPSLDP